MLWCHIAADTLRCVRPHSLDVCQHDRSGAVISSRTFTRERINCRAPTAGLVSMQIIGLFKTYPNNVLTACTPNGESVHTYCECAHREPWRSLWPSFAGRLRLVSARLLWCQRVLGGSHDGNDTAAARGDGRARQPDSRRSSDGNRRRDRHGGWHGAGVACRHNAGDGGRRGGSAAGGGRARAAGGVSGKGRGHPRSPHLAPSIPGCYPRLFCMLHGGREPHCCQQECCAWCAAMDPHPRQDHFSIPLAHV